MLNGGGVFQRVTICVIGNNNLISFGPNMRISSGLSITIRGDNNTIEFGAESSFYGLESSVEIIGDRCSIHFGEKAKINHDSFTCRDNESSISISDELDMGPNSSVISMEGKDVSIGENFFCSYNVEIRNTDNHSIIDMDGKRINQAKSIIIGSNVWICQNVLLLKGAVIPNGCIVAARSVVTHSFDKENRIKIGIPAVEKDKQVQWSKTRE